MQVSYAIVFMSDMRRSVEVYREVVGLPLRFESPGWTEFATGGATLALHLSKDDSAHDATKSEPPGQLSPRAASPISTRFIDGFRRRTSSASRSPKRCSALDSPSTSIPTAW